MPTPAQNLINKLPFSIAKRAQFLPIAETVTHIEVWVTAQTDQQTLDEFRLHAGLPIRPIMVETPALMEAIQQAYANDAVDTGQLVEDMPFDKLAQSLAQTPDLLEAEDDDAPIVRLVNSMILQAVQRKASDIHIEPFENDIIVRFRIDGMLHEILRPPKPVQAPLMSRIKVMADLNIAEKRRPQDGSMRIQIGQKAVDVRVSVLPTAHGERLVLRLLDNSERLAELNTVGFETGQIEQIQQCLHLSHGIILVTGPTGSGKTTSLYAALNKIQAVEKNIITIEDPIEYSLPGVGQIQVNPKIDLTFAQGLRAILRQDPDVIMLGEIRDLETAEIAIQASLTGHLVLSTLHTNDAASAITRLVDMGIEPFLLGSSLEAVIAQRLVRKLCSHCREPYQPKPSLLARINETTNLPEQTTFYRAKGCDQCMGTGYSGRTALIEMLRINDNIRELIDARTPVHRIRQHAAEQGTASLYQIGIHKASQGITSLEEVFRVTQMSSGMSA